MTSYSSTVRVAVLALVLTHAFALRVNKTPVLKKVRRFTAAGLGLGTVGGTVGGYFLVKDKSMTTTQKVWSVIGMGFAGGLVGEVLGFIAGGGRKLFGQMGTMDPPQMLKPVRQMATLDPDMLDPDMPMDPPQMLKPVIQVATLDPDMLDPDMLLDPPQMLKPERQRATLDPDM